MAFVNEKTYFLLSKMKVTCSCGNSFETQSTYGKDLHVEICSSCHPFYTGQQKIVDTAGRVDSFRRKYSKRKKPTAAYQCLIFYNELPSYHWPKLDQFANHDYGERLTCDNPTNYKASRLGQIVEKCLSILTLEYPVKPPFLDTHTQFICT